MSSTLKKNDWGLAYERAFAGRLGDVLENMMPGGRLIGREYLCASLEGGAGDGCRTDIITGVGSDSTSGKSWENVEEMLNILHPEPDDFKRCQWMEQECGALYRLIPKMRKQPGRKNIAVSPVPDDAPPRLERHPKYGKAVKFWEYRNHHGRLYHYTALFEVGGKVVSVSQCLFFNDQKGFFWMWKHMPEPRPLFNLAEIFHSNPDRQVLVVKDERAVQAAQQILPDVPCTCWSGGWSDVSEVDLQPFCGEAVYIWPDNDKAGFEKALSLATWLEDEAEMVFILCLPDVFPEGWTLGHSLPSNIEPWKLLINAKSVSEFVKFANSNLL